MGVADAQDANGHLTARTSDQFGRLREVAEFSGNNGSEGAYNVYALATYAYDGRDLLTGATDQLGNGTSMVYDGLGRKTSMHDPDMGDWAYTYHPDGTLYQQTDAKGQVATFAYDTLGRLTSRTTPADGRVLGYSYDSTAGGNQGKGRLTGTSVTAGGTAQQTTATTYDTRGRVTGLATWTSALGATRSFTYTYDTADRNTQMVYPTGEVVTNTYDAGWRQASLCTSLGGCYASGATYSALDAPTGWTYGNSLAQGFGYDTLGRVTSVQVGGGSVLNLGYTYDNVGNVDTNTDTLNSQTQNYDYDHRDRLTRGWTTGSATGAYDESYTYNAIGNITGKGPTGSLATYGYNPSGTGSVRPHAVTSVGGNVYAYDNNGNMTSRTGKAITWNADNTVASVVGPDNIPEGYTYDASGGRSTRSRNLGQTGGFTTVYIGGLYEEDAPSGTVRVLYVFAGKAICQRSIVGGTATLTYLHGDMLGSVGATTSSAGAVTATQRYTPFGAVRAGGGLPTTIDFTGQRRDGTGLLFYVARYYDPAIGRFVSADAIAPEKGNPQSRNRYSYVLNNPLNYTDPSGHEPQDPRTDLCWTAEYARQCGDYVGELAAYGIDVQNPDSWSLYELHWALRAVEMLADAFGGGGMRDQRIEMFKRCMGISERLSESRLRFFYSDAPSPTGYAENDGVRNIIFHESTFYSRHPGAVRSRYVTESDINYHMLGSVVHELAHMWDARSSRAGGARHSAGFLLWVAQDPRAPFERPVSSEPHNPIEEFAESVAALVIGNWPGHPNFQNSARADYIRTKLFESGNGNAPPER